MRSASWRSAFLICALACVHAFGDQSLPQQVKVIFRANCYRCHGEGGIDNGGMAFVIDLSRLVTQQEVKPGQPDESKLFRKLASGKMPPSEDDSGKPVLQRPTKEQVDLVRQWIAEGAKPDVAPVARTFISDADILKMISDDLAAAPEQDRRFYRYFTLTHLYNAGQTDDELQTYRNALAKLINSLSWGREISLPRAVDAARTIVRININDYDWSETIWTSILGVYPYGVVYADPIAKGVYSRTGCDVPYVRADWFVSAAGRPPLYYDVLKIPQTDAELERLLQVDVLQRFNAQQVACAGFNGSGVSRNNRVIHRYKTPFGAIWKSYDFRDPAKNQRKNIFSHPLGPGADKELFEQDGGEIIFNLPNGLQGYMLVNDKGARIDKGPIDVVSDPKQADRAVVCGVSCISCHAQGMIEKQDQVRDAVVNNRAGFDAATIKLVEAIYPTKKEFAKLLEEDAKRFNDAIALLGIARGGEEPIVSLSLRFEQSMEINLAAAEAGVTVAEFKALVARSRVLSRDIGSLNTDGGTVQRSVFAASFADVVRELGAGTLPPHIAPAGALVSGVYRGTLNDAHSPAKGEFTLTITVDAKGTIRGTREYTFGANPGAVRDRIEGRIEDGKFTAVLTNQVYVASGKSLRFPGPVTWKGQIRANRISGTWELQKPAQDGGWSFTIPAAGAPQPGR